VGGSPELTRAFLDANVLVAGARSRTGASRAILRLGEITLLDAVTSPFAIEEAERALTRLLPAALPAFRLLLDACCRVVAASPAVAAQVVNHAHTKDTPILAAALESECDRLVTHNVRDFRRSGPITVVTPASLMEEIRARLMRSPGRDG
jgi:predicted nucleic acid-binding protein